MPPVDKSLQILTSFDMTRIHPKAEPPRYDFSHRKISSKSSRCSESKSADRGAIRGKWETLETMIGHGIWIIHQAYQRQPTMIQQIISVQVKTDTLTHCSHWQNGLSHRDLFDIVTAWDNMNHDSFRVLVLHILAHCHDLVGHMNTTEPSWMLIMLTPVPFLTMTVAVEWRLVGWCAAWEQKKVSK